MKHKCKFCNKELDSAQDRFYIYSNNEIAEDSPCICLDCACDESDIRAWLEQLYEQLSDRLIERCLSEKDWIEKSLSQIVLLEKKITSDECLK